MIRRILKVGAVVAVLLAFAVAIRELNVDSSGGTGRPSGLAPGIALFAPEERRPLPVLEGTTLTGSNLSTKDLDAEVLVVNLWGSWCPPCRAEMPALVRISQQYRERGVSVLGINTRDDDDEANAFVRRFKVGFPSLVDENGELTLALRNVIAANAVPSTIVVDRDGLVAARVIGPITETTLRNMVDDVLQGQAR